MLWLPAILVRKIHCFLVQKSSLPGKYVARALIVFDTMSEGKGIAQKSDIHCGVDHFERLPQSAPIGLYLD